MPSSHFQYDRLIIVGVGLIGGSIALAARKQKLCREILGVGRNGQRLAAAQTAGVIDGFVTDACQIPKAEIAIVCTPVDRIADDVKSLARSSNPPALITDAGSVKTRIVEELVSSGAAGRFVGSHPLAGSHLVGFENADADLFRHRLCVVTPTEETFPKLVDQVAEFWKLLGMRVQEMSSEEHDRRVALTSHLPHLTAAALTSLVEVDNLPFASTGFRDTTRIAAGDPELWTAIFMMNSRELVGVTEKLINVLQNFRDSLEHQDTQKIRELLKTAQQIKLNEQSGS